MPRKNVSVKSSTTKDVTVLKIASGRWFYVRDTEDGRKLFTNFSHQRLILDTKQINALGKLKQAKERISKLIKIGLA